MKCWNVGNTTVRNPKRIKDALRILQQEFSGKAWDVAQHVLFYRTLIERGIVEIKDDSTLAIKSAGINGRKWAAAFNQLGLAKVWKKKGIVELTPAGLALATDKALEEDIFLRQLLKHQLPSPIEPRTRKLGFEVQPLRLFLAILTELGKRNIKGVTKEEIALFVIITLKNSDYLKAVANIEEYRTKRSALIGKVPKKEFYRKTKVATVGDLYSTLFESLHKSLESLVEQQSQDPGYLESQDGQELLLSITGGGKGARTKKAMALARMLKAAFESGLDIEDLFDLVSESRGGIKGHTLEDYADSMVRYFMQTGLFSLSGDKLIVRDTQWQLVKAIVAQGFSLVPYDTYEEYFYSAESPTLPSDEIAFLQTNILALQKKREELRKQVKISQIMEASPTHRKEDLLSLKRYQAQLEKELLQYKEELFYRSQAEQVNDIISYYEQIRDRSLLGGTAYLPAYLEWTTWRVFLAINTIANEISKTHNFNIDDEVNPIHHAKAGQPDMLFDYDDFTIVCEVTLHTGEKQWNAEGEPVPRHVAEVVKHTSKKPVFGVFIAPKIDPNTAQQFLYQKWYIGNKYVPLNILPLTIDQVQFLLRAIQSSSFSVDDMKQVFQFCCELKGKSSDGLEWLKQISQFLASRFAM